MCVEVEAGAVVADGVSADGRWRVFKLLGDVFDHGLAVHAQEGAAHLEAHGSHYDILLKGVCASRRSRDKSYQFRVNWVRPHHLTTDPHQ